MLLASVALAQTSEDRRPDDETRKESLFATERVDKDGAPILSYPGRTPEDPGSAPGNRRPSHIFTVPAQVVIGGLLGVIGAGVAGVIFCGDLGLWAEAVFTKDACSIGSLLVGAVGVWGGVTVGSSYLHGADYNGDRAEAIALVALGTVLGVGLASLAYVAVDSRALAAVSSATLPIAGAIIFGELAAHEGNTEDKQLPFAGIGAGPTRGGAQLSYSLRF